MELRRQLRIARKWLPLLVAFAVLGAAAAFGLSSIQQRVYEARATLIVGQSLEALNPDFNQLMVSQRLSTTYAAVATTWPALTRVIEKLHLGTTPAELGKRVFAEARSDSTLMTVTAQDTDPARAAAIANALADDLIAGSPATQGRDSEFQQSIDEDLQATQDQIKATQERVDTLAALARPEPEDLATLESLQGRLASLRSTYASLLAYSTGSAGNLLSIVEPALAPDGTGPAADAAQHDAGQPRRPVPRVRARRDPRVPRRPREERRHDPGDRRPEHARDRGPDGDGRRPRGVLPAGDAPVPTLGGRRVVPDAAEQHRVRARSTARCGRSS